MVGIRLACPLCSCDSAVRFRIGEFSINDCLHCRHRFATGPIGSNHVDAIYDDSYFTGGGAGYANYADEAVLLRRQGRRYARLAERWMKPGRMLDVGAAAGFILDGFQSRGWIAQGVEPNAAMAQLGQQRGLRIDIGTLESADIGSTFDLVAAIQVVAHFVDPSVALAKLATLVRPGGLLLVESWNRESETARWLGRYWHEYSPPSVLHWYSPNSLQRCLLPLGFEEIRRGRPIKRINGSHAVSLLRDKLRAMPLSRCISPFLRLVPDRLVIPYPSEDLFWGVYRRR